MSYQFKLNNEWTANTGVYNTSTLEVSDTDSFIYDPSITLTLFSRHSVLARAIETTPLGADERLNLRNWDWECEKLKSHEGRKNACCTLLVSGEPVATHDSFGFLFNSETAQVFHAASHDINSYVGSDGIMSVPQEEGTLENMSIESLKKYILSTPAGLRDEKNEVNAHFKAKDILGLFINEMDAKSTAAALLNLQIIFIQNHLKIKHGLDLPLFIFNTKKGQIRLFNDQYQQIPLLMIRTKRELGFDTLRLVAGPLGYTVDPKGRIERANV